jgi:hypothetical protein
MSILGRVYESEGLGGTGLGKVYQSEGGCRFGVLCKILVDRGEGGLVHLMCKVLEPYPGEGGGRSCCMRKRKERLLQKSESCVML